MGPERLRDSLYRIAAMSHTPQLDSKHQRRACPCSGPCPSAHFAAMKPLWESKVSD